MAARPSNILIPERNKTMHTQYNMNQLTLDITTSYVPKKDNTAWFIHKLVESLELREPYLFGRPREYSLSAMLKLVLFAYTRSVFSSRKIEQLAEESLPARWLTQEMTPSYRTIARFRISEELETLIGQGLAQLTAYLREKNMIDDAIFIDGTKILADANKYSFVWKKATIKFDQMNRKQIVDLMTELRDVYQTKQLPKESELTLDQVDEVLTQLELRLADLEEEVKQTAKVSPNPAKQQRRCLNSQKRKLTERREKMSDHETRLSICGDRNSYSKTDHDATFMRIKEDPMKNGQLKPAYNLQIATSQQFILGYDLYQNPTDTRTLQPFLEKLKATQKLPTYIVTDAGYGSESNYRYLEDECPQQTALIPYGTMLKEQTRKWQSDEKKVMNWTYHEEEDYYIDLQGVRFNFHAYRTTTDKTDGFVRQFKEYVAEKYDENHCVIPASLTPKGYLKKIKINPSWEYFKAKQVAKLSDLETGRIYAQRKIDVEPVFGFMKASLGFTRYHVRTLEKVKRETGILVLAINMRKLAAQERQNLLNSHKNPRKMKISMIFQFPWILFCFVGSYVTASFFLKNLLK